MKKISDMLKNKTKKFLINDDKLLELLEELFEREGYYKTIQNHIDNGMLQNKNEVSITFSICDIKKHMRKYLKKDETFTEDQLVKTIVRWAKEQEKTMETKFEWKFERDLYDDLYCDIIIGLR